MFDVFLDVLRVAGIGLVDDDRCKKRLGLTPEEINALLLKLLDEVDPRKRQNQGLVMPKTPQQSVYFRNEVIRWMNELKQEGHFTKGLAIGKSYLDEGHGSKSVIFL